MTSFQLGSIGICLVLLAGCSEEKPPQDTQTPLTLNVDNSSQVALKIPGVDDEIPEIAELTTDEKGIVTGTIDRADVPATVDTDSNVPTIDIPRPLLLSDVVHNRFSNLLQGPAGVEILDAVVYPLGWSPDGKLAYAIEPPDEAVGSYFLNVYVQDLVTDKILWQDKYQSEPESTTDIQSFAAYWQANQAKMEAQLQKYKIKQVNDSVLFAGSISNKDDRLDYVVQKKLKGQPDLGNLAMVTEYQVTVTSEKLGSKTVHKEKITNNARILDVDVIGYLRGDDEERVALLIAGVRRGWEGPPHTTWFKVVGTNVKRGFKKAK
jgi:hypothetical protein